jgi:hypothetical protein
MKPRGHIDYQILLRDAAEGIRYTSFEDYYTRRLAKRAIFFPDNPKGALLACQTRVKELVRECWESFAKDHPDLIAVADERPRPTTGQHPIGECAPVGGFLCRRNYPGQSACTRFEGSAVCLLVQETADV